MENRTESPTGTAPSASPPLRICVMAHYTADGGGLSVAQNLIPAIVGASPQHTYLFTVQRGIGLEKTAAAMSGGHVIAVGPWRNRFLRWLWETYALPRLVRRFAPDVVLDLNSRGLVRPPCPQAILMQRPRLFYPRRHYARETAQLKMVRWCHAAHLRQSLRRTQLLLCQTTVAADRMRDTYGYEGRIDLCPNAVSRFTRAGEGHRQMPSAMAPYADRFCLLCLTRYYAHKNLEVLPEIFERFPGELKDVAVFLTIAEDQHPGAARLLRRIRRRRLADQVVNVGPLPQEELAAYYANCQAMILPTLVESFTATYLEAMHFGLPILTSDLDFAHVVCEDAALYFDPWDAASVKDAIVRLKDDAALRGQLVVRGRSRLEGTEQSWGQIGAGVAAALEQIARPPSAASRPKGPGAARLPGPPRAGAPRLRLAVLAQAARASGGHSVGKNLIAAMGRAAPDVDFFLALHADAELEQLGRSIAGENLVTCDRRDLPGRWQWEISTLPRLLRKFAPDVVLDLSSRGLRRPPCPQAILCQRAHYFYPAADWGPETFKNKLLFRLHARHFRRALSRTRLVLCQTPTAQRRLRDSCGFAGRTALCPNALSADVLAAPRAAPVPWNLAAHVGEFKLLCVSRYFPHKNLEALVEVFRRHGPEMPDVAAVITILPQHHPKAAALLGRVEALGLSSRILNVGPVGQGELASYYCNCQAMILPTLLESFSGTYLEAMHFGLPILTSDRDFAHAVCGDAALYFDPKDPDSIFEAIRGLRLDPVLGQRLVERGRRRLAAFPTWDRIAQDLIGELRRIARSPE